jgi:hypothetical protein
MQESEVFEVLLDGGGYEHCSKELSPVKSSKYSLGIHAKLLSPPSSTS